MTRVIIIGAAGRMGRRLIALLAEDSQLRLAGAIEAPGHALLGQDAGVVAGVAPLKVPLTADLNAALALGDVTIDFSAAEAVVGNVRAALAAQRACVIGTTGLSDAALAELRALADGGGRIVQAPNMSVGVNLLFSLCEQVARVLGEDYDIEIVEMHHNQKRDAPSGTAKALAEGIAAARGLDYARDTVHGRQGLVGARPRRQIGMHALRGGDVVGDHTVVFAAQGERIELTHRAGSRDTFARGALRAAKFIAKAKPGLYDMRAVLGLR